MTSGPARGVPHSFSRCLRLLPRDLFRHPKRISRSLIPGTEYPAQSVKEETFIYQLQWVQSVVGRLQRRHSLAEKAAKAMAVRNQRREQLAARGHLSRSHPRGHSNRPTARPAMDTSVEVPRDPVTFHTHEIWGNSWISTVTLGVLQTDLARRVTGF